MLSRYEYRNFLIAPYSFYQLVAHLCANFERKFYFFLCWLLWSFTRISLIILPYVKITPKYTFNMSASSVNNILQISLCILLFLRPIFANEHCIQDRNCRCVYESGRGLDLNKKFASDDYILSASLNNLTYYFHACKDVHTLPISPNDLNKTANGCYNEKDGYSVIIYLFDHKF